VVCAHEGLRRRPRRPAESSAPTAGLHTGDLGIMHDDGCIHLTGRSRDVIIRGGENIYPRGSRVPLHPPKSTSAGRRHPNASWARCGRLSACGGVESTEAEIREFCQGQIAYYKIRSTSALWIASRLPCPARFRSTRFASSRSRRGVAVGGVNAATA